MRTEHGEIWYFNDSRFIQLRSIYIKRKEKGRELNGREKEREGGEVRVWQQLRGRRRFVRTGVCKTCV